MQAALTLKSLTKDQLKAVVDHVGSDGHTIFHSRVLEKAGWPQEAIAAVCSKYESDGSPKGTIFGNNGEVLPAVLGWYGLDVITRIARDLGVKYEWKDGRGFRAASIYKALTEYFNKEPVNG